MGVAEAFEIEFGAVDLPAAGAGGEEEASVAAADIEDAAGRAGMDGLGDDARAAAGAPAGGERVAVTVVAVSVISSEILGDWLCDAVMAARAGMDGEGVSRERVQGDREAEAGWGVTDGTRGHGASISVSLGIGGWV